MAENKAEKPLRFIGYAQTLVEWRRRFRAAWPQVARLGFDDRFNGCGSFISPIARWDFELTDRCRFVEARTGVKDQVSVRG
jgi:hypothetical protein